MCGGESSLGVYVSVNDESEKKMSLIACFKKKVTKVSSNRERLVTLKTLIWINMPAGLKVLAILKLNCRYMEIKEISNALMPNGFDSTDLYYSS